MADPNLNDDVTGSSLWRTLVCLAAVGLIALIALVSILTSNSASRTLETLSAVWIAHDMLVAYVNQTDGEWPSDWSDLDPHFTAINQGYGLPELAWVRERVDIDFNLESARFDSANSAQDSVVWAIRMADGTENGEIRNANKRIRSLMINQRSPSTKPQKVRWN